MESDKTLTIFCLAGLANRIRVLVSGIAAAEVTGRTFRMFWPSTPACSAAFRELFTNNWPVIDVENPDQLLRFNRSNTRTPLGSIENLITDPQQNIVLGATDWIIDCQRHRAPAMHARCCKLLGELEPLPELAEQIAEIQQSFQPVMIGVHLRRGDFQRKRPDVAWNTRTAFRAIDRFLKKAPEAGILLCSDDGAVNWRTGDQINNEGVHEAFQKRYGDRVITTSPGSLDRRTMESAQDALVDLWLLRSTHMIVGTTGSSFSYLSAFDRDVEYAWVGGKSPVYSVIHWLVVLTGVHWLVCTLFRAKYGHDRPFPVAWRRLVRNPKRNMKAKQDGIKG